MPISLASLVCLDYAEVMILDSLGRPTYSIAHDEQIALAQIARAALSDIAIEVEAAMRLSTDGRIGIRVDAVLKACEKSYELGRNGRVE